ncbi:ElyC/SanA/YdcF family protein [Curtobacterium sp. A7_M15]|uniref:ElyC/SanA/YdcF family protein n=1 Tax=Curtobacterium sp. A7_M15 TaxID=3065241 RepID=UPI002737C745|nr:ElyC/SanA/YdcF family protein [Curtobacterium sp. A7_M15]MDP4332069.1 ElyC/SanA/YdcF family protein [Curtobacterium sp. A7_M15]
MAAILSATGLAVLLAGELVHSLTARQAVGLPRPTPGSTVLVVVLGFGNRGRRINTVNRWRARIAIRTARAARTAGASAAILCSGGAVRGSTAEAVILRDYITQVLHWDGPVSVESRSRSTWENVRNSLPWVASTDWVAFASNGLHAAKARVYLARQRPDLCSRIVAAKDYRFGEMIVLKPLFGAVGLWKLRTLFHVEHSP